MLVPLVSKILTALVLTAVSAASEISTSHTVTDLTTATSTSAYPKDDFSAILELISRTNSQQKDPCTFFRKELASKSNEEIVKYLNARGNSLETCLVIVNCRLHKKQDKICGPEINDAGNCFPPTLAGHNAIISCPGVVGELEFDTSIDATRLCKEDGSWAPRADYGQCKPLEKYRKKACINDWPQNLTSEEKDERERQCNVRFHNLKIIRYVGNSLSLVTLVISFILFWMLKSIRCWRNIIHWNLVASFILRIILWFIYYESPLVSVEESDVPSVALCKIVVSLFHYAQATNYFWMFVEGLYLHMMVVMAYSYDRINLRVYNAIGWGFPVLLTSLWAILKLTVENESCWVSQVKEVKKVDYAFQIPIIALLLINAVILGNVVRILLTKLRSGFAFGGTGPGEAAQYTKAVKAAVFLFPLLGITFILFFISPPDPVGEMVFMYFNGFMQAFQGFFVCLIYCFANNEIQRALVKKIHHWRWQMRWPFCLWPKKDNMNRSGSNASLSRTHNTIVHMRSTHNDDTHHSGRQHESAGSSPLLLVEHREEEKEGAPVVSVSVDGGTSSALTSV